VTKKARWRRVTYVCVELLSSRLSIDSLLLNTYSASGRRTVHLATTYTALRALASAQLQRFDTSLLFFDVDNSSSGLYLYITHNSGTSLQSREPYVY